MRISDQQKYVIIQNARQYFGRTATVYLFGSRVDDSKKGGDIDLYIETDLTEGLIRAKLDFLGALQDAFGEQKIDILVRSRSKSMTAIQEIAKETGVEL